MADLNQINELTLAVRSRILEQIHASLNNPAAAAATTQYVKSDGTNYGMYTKNDPNLTNIWDTVINQRSVSVPAPVRIVNPQNPIG